MNPLERVDSVMNSLGSLPSVEGLPLREIGARVILSTCATEKVSLTLAAYKSFFPRKCGSPRPLSLGEPRSIEEGERKGADVPGLVLMHASRLPNIGKGGSVKSQAMILHALVHVELAAVDISWDLIVRDWGRAYEGKLTDDFYLDWLEVAFEEAKHYLVLRSRLKELWHNEASGSPGKHYDYGDFPAHEGIWQDALRTRHCLMERLALEHLTHEARGVDVCSLVTVPRLRRGGDIVSADLLESVVIVDEVDHIKKGFKYFKALLCSIPVTLVNEQDVPYGQGQEEALQQQSALDVTGDDKAEAEALDKFLTRRFHDVMTKVQGYCFPKGPFAVELRRQAGMPDSFYVKCPASSLLPPPPPPPHPIPSSLTPHEA